ncbi:MAG: hypothetical protein ACXVP7_05680 [Actinomycetota bacterium]
MRRTAVIIASLLVSVAWSSLASAAPGGLDPFFSHDGWQTAFPNGAVAEAVAIDHHGRIVLAGYTLAEHPDIALARFTPGGRLDPTFGADGKVVTDLGVNDYAFDVAIQDDGGIVVAGERRATVTDRIVVLRYRPNGSLDPRFGTAGTVLTSFGRRFQSADAVAIAPSGKIVVAGSTSNGTTSRSALVRYRRNGRLDPSFGGDGRVTTDVSRSAEQFTDVVAKPDGSLVAAGWAEVSLVPVFDAVSYTSEGRLDTTFGDRGVARLDPSAGPDRASALAVQGDGKLVLVGSAAAGGRHEWAVVRLGPHGRLDPSFGDGGAVVTSFGPGFDEAGAVAIQSNGKIVVAGRIHARATDDFGIVRFRVGGRHDVTFGQGGRVLTDLAGGADAIFALAIQPNGKIVAAGQGTIDGERRFAVARYLPR